MANHDVKVVVKAYDQASRKFGTIGKAAARMGKVLKKAAIGAGAIAAAVGVGLALLVKQEMKNIDTTAKLADRLNMSTENLTALQFAAELAGSSADTFNKSVEVMIRRMGEVRLGVGQAKLALVKLGLEVDDLVNKDPAQVFELLAKKIAKLPTAADQASVAYYLMGRRGMELLNLMKRLEKEGLSAVRAEAEKLGLTFSRLDASKVEAANDAILRLKALFKGVARILTVELAPVITALATQLTSAATSGVGLKEKIIDALEKMSFGLLGVGQTIDSVSIKWLAFAAGAHEGVAAIYDLCDAMTNLDELFGEWTYKGLAEEHRKTAAELIEKTIPLTNEYFESVRKLEEFFAKLRDRAEENANTASKGFLNTAIQIAKVNEQLTEQIELYGLSAQEKQLFEMRKLGEGLEGEELENFNRMLAETEKNMAKLEEMKVFATLEQSAKSLVESLQTPVERFKEVRAEFEKMLEAGLITSKQFERAIQEAGEEILKTGIQKQVEAPTWQSLPAQESRFLTRAPGGTVQTYQKETASNTKEAIKSLRELVRINQQMARESESANRRRTSKIEFVSSNLE